MFCKKYRAALISNCFRVLLFVNLYLIYLIPKIKCLSSDIFVKYPDLAREERMLLVESAKSGLIMQGVFVSLAIVVVLYFPLLLIEFKMSVQESFFDCVKRIKKEKEEAERNSNAEKNE